MVKTSIGLELTEDALRAVEVTTGRAQHVLRHAEVALPAGAARDSEVLDADAVVLALRTLWARGGFRSRTVTLGVGSRRILVREHTVQARPLRQLKAALPQQVQHLLPVPVDQAVLDFYPLTEEGGQVRGFLVAAVAETVTTLVDTLARARLRAARVDFAPFGLARALGRVAPAGEACALVYIGDHTTSVVVATNGVPTYVRIIPVDLTAPVALEERLGELVGAVRAGVREPLPAAPGAGSAAQDLAHRVRETIAFAEGRPGATPIESLRLSGAGAADATVCAAIADAVGMSAILTGADDVLPGVGAGPHGARARFELVSTIGIVLGEQH